MQISSERQAQLAAQALQQASHVQASKTVDVGAKKATSKDIQQAEVSFRPGTHHKKRKDKPLGRMQGQLTVKQSFPLAQADIKAWGDTADNLSKQRGKAFSSLSIIHSLHSPMAHLLLYGTQQHAVCTVAMSCCPLHTWSRNLGSMGCSTHVELCRMVLTEITMSGHTRDHCTTMLCHLVVVD